MGERTQCVGVGRGPGCLFCMRGGCMSRVRRTGSSHYQEGNKQEVRRPQAYGSEWAEYRQYGQLPSRQKS